MKEYGLFDLIGPQMIGPPVPTQPGPRELVMWPAVWQGAA